MSSYQTCVYNKLHKLSHAEDAKFGYPSNFAQHIDANFSYDVYSSDEGCCKMWWFVI